MPAGHRFVGGRTDRTNAPFAAGSPPPEVRVLVVERRQRDCAQAWGELILVDLVHALASKLHGAKGVVEEPVVRGRPTGHRPVQSSPEALATG